jgi:hypothetical protein
VFGNIEEWFSALLRYIPEFLLDEDVVYRLAVVLWNDDSEK